MPPPRAPGAAAAAPAKDPRDTPAMRQYARFKQRHPGCLLLFRMGDFYEMFDDDAVAASRAIGLTLTQRTAGIPMAGVPYHQIDAYARKLIGAGFRVAVCDQVQDAAEAKGLVERAVTRVLTPGTLLDEHLLQDDRANVIGAVCFPPAPVAPGAAAGGSITLATGPAALAIAELSTGELTVTLLDAAHVPDELARRGVRELLYPETVGALPERIEALARATGLSPTAAPAWSFRPAEALEALRTQYGVATLAGFGLADSDPLVLPAGALVRYLQQTQLPQASAGAGEAAGAEASGVLAHLRPPRKDAPTDHLVIDAVSLRALEIDRTIRAGAGASEGSAEGSLLGVFVTPGGRHLCRTAMGKRQLRDWLVRPLRSLEAIRARQRVVALLAEDRRLAQELGGLLEGVQDVARIGARIALGRATPRDVVALGRSLAQVGALVQAASGAPALAGLHARLVAVHEKLAPLGEEILRTCQQDSPPAHLREGGLFKGGIDPELDRQRDLQTGAAEWMAAYQAQLISEHNLPNLKVGYNKIFGYFIELPRAQAQRAPASFSRRQTLTGAERYVTPPLKEFEDKVTHAQARAVAREQALFEALCARAREQLPAIGAFGACAADLDVLGALADKAVQARWVCPQVVDAPTLDIEQGRHPVLELTLRSDFVPNDLALATPAQPGALALITGPNMAGKSTFIRQTALLVLLAHVGSFVPAQRATVGLCDRLFTRVGADDALYAGQSTFMVEMTETASILHHATSRSVVILDEIGRGTSTLDGLSLAWAIAETLAGAGGPRTLFATHYHELTQLPEPGSPCAGRVVNLHVAVREWQDKIVFLHRILPGRAEKSFGIHVARLAGVPARTLARAKEVLDQLSVQHAGQPAKAPGRAGARREPTLFHVEPPPAPEPAPAIEHPAVDALREIKLEALSPLQAFDELRRLKGLA
jgi:DNA mismatch repair protein MutS